MRQTTLWVKFVRPALTSAPDNQSLGRQNCRNHRHSRSEAQSISPSRNVRTGRTCGGTRGCRTDSRKIEKHAVAVALNYFAYNFIKIHSKLRMSPAHGGRRDGSPVGSVRLGDADWGWRVEAEKSRVL